MTLMLSHAVMTPLCKTAWPGMAIAVSVVWGAITASSPAPLSLAVVPFLLPLLGILGLIGLMCVKLCYIEVDEASRVLRVRSYGAAISIPLHHVEKVKPALAPNWPMQIVFRQRTPWGKSIAFYPAAPFSWRSAREVEALLGVKH